MTIHASKRLPSHTWGVHAGLIWLCLGLTVALAAEPHALVTVQRGDLPLIVSAPHGGNEQVPGAEPRLGAGLERKPGGFVTSRDVGTLELAHELADAVTWRFGKRPYLVLSKAHRKFVDPNRPADAAVESTAGQAVHDAYHQAMADACRDVQARFHAGLLLDLHGQSAAADIVFRGTKNGATVALLRERGGEEAHRGDQSLLGRLKSRGWTVHPDPFDGREQPGFTGGYIVQHYGGHSGFGIDAIQLEFGSQYRKPERRAKTASELTEALAEFAPQYLQWQLAPPIKVAVFQGPGTGNSREKLMATLSKLPRLKLRDITADEIRAGQLQGARIVIHPGGSGGGQGRALGPEGREQIQRFVREGGGYLGICAGAYLATCDYEWSLHLLDGKVIDRQHWNRGFGTVDIGLTPRGRRLLGAESERLAIYYHQGPLLAPAQNPAIPDYDRLAGFETEISKNGAASGVMIGRTAIAAGDYHRGRVFCFSPHPELTDGLETILWRALAWSAGENLSGQSTAEQLEPRLPTITDPPSAP